MGRPHPKELRERVVAHVLAGNTHHSAAARFDVSVKFVNDMVKLKRETGSLAPKRQGNPGIGKLTPHEDWVRAQVETRGEITLDEMTARLLSERGISCYPQFGLTTFPSPWADAQTKTFRRWSRSVPKVARERHIWIVHRQPFMAHMLERIGFLDETWLKTNMTKTTGGHRAGSGLSIMRLSGIGVRKHLSQRCATTGGCALGDRRHHEPRNIRNLCRNPTRADAAQRRCDHPGQPVQPQKHRAAEELLMRRMVLVPATVLTRSEPHRDGLLKAQGADQKGGSQNI